MPGERICLSVIYLGKVDCDNARAAPSNGTEIARVLTNDLCHIQQMAAAAKYQVGQHAAEILLCWTKSFFLCFEKLCILVVSSVLLMLQMTMGGDASNKEGGRRVVVLNGWLGRAG